MSRRDTPTNIKDRPRSAGELATDNYEPSSEVKAIMAKHGVRDVPPAERIGSRSVRWEGNQFTLPAIPEALGLRESANILLEKAEEEEQIVSISEVIDALPWDGAQAFALAVEDLFGWGIWKPQMGFFGPIPPTMRTIKTGPGPDDHKQVFWGKMVVPQLEAELITGMTSHEDRMVFQIRGSIAKKNRHRVDTLVALARIYAMERSIYKGKAIRMFVDDDGDLDDSRDPEFIKIDPQIEHDLIFSDEVLSQINTNLFAPIEYPQACRRLGIPLKRGILLEGPYGVGKSMTAAATASKCVREGWTFIMLDRVAGLKQILDFAHRYAPAVVFAEDIDRVIAGDRSVKIDDVLNTLDGVQGKAHEIVTVLTSNHADKINHAMLRPGRLDAIISVTPPDAVAAERLMRLYARGLIPANVPLPNAAAALAGHIPAVIREAVERAKLTAIYRTKGNVDCLTDEDLVVAAATMATHLSLMAGPSERTLTPEERLGQALADVVAERINPTDKRLKEVEETADKILEIVS